MGFLTKVQRFFRAPKVRPGYEVLTGRSLYEDLGREWSDTTQGMALPGGLFEKIYENPIHRNVLKKYIPDIENIVKSGHGISLYTYGEPRAKGKPTLADISPKIRRVTHRHETFHRAIEKRASEFKDLGFKMSKEIFLGYMVGDETGSLVMQSRGGNRIKGIYGKFTFNEYFASYASSVPPGGYKHQETFIKAIRNLQLDPVISDWFDATGIRLSYFKMKKYLGEPTGAAAWISNKTIEKSGVLKRMFSAGAKKGIISAALAGSMMFGGTAYAHNEVAVGENVPIIQRTEKLKSLTDRIAGVGNASDLLYETAIHESGDLKYSRQMVTKKIGKKNYLVPEGRARSIFMVEPETAKNLVDWSKTRPKALNLLVAESGKTAEELFSMSKSQLAGLLMEHDHFAAAMARVKYLSSPGKIPGTLEARSKYWADYYMAGQKRDVKARQYVTDNQRVAEQVTAARTAEIMKKNNAIAPKPTAGLVNKALHSSKTSSKMGTASSKAAAFIKKITKR
jgi:hypothetical protein